MIQAVLIILVGVGAGFVQRVSDFGLGIFAAFYAYSYRHRNNILPLFLRNFYMQRS